MINALSHTPTGAVVQFEKSPSRGNAETRALVQSAGHDSDGSFYCYTKTTKKSRSVPFTFETVAQSTLDDLLIFMQSRNGDKNLFSWFDHEAAEHVVRFGSGRIGYRETSPDRFRVSFQLLEEI